MVVSNMGKWSNLMSIFQMGWNRHENLDVPQRLIMGSNPAVPWLAWPGPFWIRHLWTSSTALMCFGSRWLDWEMSTNFCMEICGSKWGDMSNLKWPSQSPQHLSICWGCTNGDPNICTCTCDRKLRPAGMPSGVLPSHLQVFFWRSFPQPEWFEDFKFQQIYNLRRKKETQPKKKEKKTTWTDIGTDKWQFQIGYLQVQLVGDLRMGMVRWKLFGFDCTRKTWAWWGSWCNALLESMIAFLSKTSHYTFRITCTSYNVYIHLYTQCMK